MSCVPDVSVIIPAFNARETIQTCLESVAGQETTCRFEIIVVESSNDGTATLVRSRFPEVRLIVVPERKYPGDARNLGIVESQGSVLAMIDADCTAAPDWLQCIYKAHESESGGVGGSMANRSESLFGWASYFTEYSEWMPGTPAGKMKSCPGGVMSYPRSVFDELGLFQEGGYGSDAEFHYRMRTAGYLIRFDPRIRVTHHSSAGFRELLRHAFFHGSQFGSLRRWHLGYGGRRWLHALLLPLVWFLVFGRLGLRAFVCRTYVFPFLFASPFTALGVGAWVLGEVRGHFGRESVLRPADDASPSRQ